MEAARTTRTAPSLIESAKRSGAIDAKRDLYRRMPNEDMRDAYNTGWSSIRPLPAYTPAPLPVAEHDCYSVKYRYGGAFCAVCGETLA